VITELAVLAPHARVATIAGGHIPHATNSDQWVATLVDLHDAVAAAGRGAAR
jgi:hypothetical protein